MDNYHVSVLLKEAIDLLKIKENMSDEAVFVDTTLGGGGHSKAIYTAMNAGTLISLDQDDDALNYVKNNIYEEQDGKKWILKKGNFSDLKKLVKSEGFEEVDGILYDLGVSSYQIDSKARGFSFMKNAPLDMRMNKDTKLTAEYVVNNYEKNELNRIFREYGEEPHAKRITNAILEYRAKKKIMSSRELMEIINVSFGAKSGLRERTAKRVFQALRVEVNKELSALSLSITQAFEILKKDGRCNIITFQPLERKLVENELIKHQSIVKLDEIVKPGAIELVNNLRSKSAVMYIISKL